MNVVIVGAALPFPTNSGNRIRTWNLLTRLARRHRLIYIGTRNPDRTEAAEALAAFDEHGIEAIEVEHTVPSKQGMGFYARLAGNLLSPLPYSVASHQAPALTAAAHQVANRCAIDLWQAEWAAGLAAFRDIPGARKLVVAHNVETLIWERYAQVESHPLKRWYIRQQCRKFERFEHAAFAEADRIVAVSPDDAALIRGRFGVTHVDVVDNGIDRAVFEKVTPHRDPRRILFLGSLEWRPNLDAVGLLLDRIFPAVRATEPDAQLDIVGRNPPASLVARAEEVEGVRLHVNVADVRPFLASSGVMAVPLRIGGGSRLKILEALATGLPVVSTAVGAEGLCLEPGRDLEIADEPEAIAAALVGAIREPERVQRRASQARRHVLDRYDWDILAEAMERSWERCVAGREAGCALSAAG